MQTGIPYWGGALWVSLAGAMPMFLTAVPKITEFTVILIIAWLIVRLVEKSVAALSQTVNFNELASRSRFGDFVGKMGLKPESAGIIALILLIAVFNALGLPAVLDALRQLLLQLPNWTATLVVLVIGGLAAGALSKLVQTSTSRAELRHPDLLATITSVSLWAFTIVCAINQIDTTFVNALFIAAVGMMTLAFGLAFGLGRREPASKIARGWYEKGKEALPKIKEALAGGKARVKRQTRQPMQPHR